MMNRFQACRVRFISFLTTILITALPSIHAKANTVNLIFDQSLTESSLFQSPKQSGKANLRVKYYDANRGLYAMYENAGGGRILFEAGRDERSGYVVIRARRAVAGVINTVASFRRGSAVGQRPTMTVGGVDVMDVLIVGQKQHGFDALQQRRLREFMRTDDAALLVDGTAALYLQLDFLESSNAVSAFKAPFGILRTSLELVTGNYRGVDQLADLVDSDKQMMLRNSCSNGRCQLQGKGFTVQRSGLFDTVSESSVRRAVTGVGQCRTESQMGSSRGGLEISTQFFEVLCGTGCHGQCGPGCCTPGEITTPACEGHDTCVTMYDHLSCLFDVPKDCLKCNNLIEAIISYIDALVSKILPN